MRVLVQRVTRAKVVVGGETTGEIGVGFLILLGITATDTDAELAWTVQKCVNLRVFADGEGKMNRSLLDLGASALVVSQFTLYGDARKGNRPSFVHAARPELAEPMYEKFCAELEKVLGAGRVATGRFGADMQVELVNDGPVTIWIEREAGALGSVETA